MTSENNPSLIRYYAAGLRFGLIRELQYRMASLMMLVGFLVEPVIYLAVWTTVAEAQGGSIAGIATGTIAAYYIVWTLVRVFNLAFAPQAWEWRIQRGRINDFLSQPIHPFHRDFTFFAGGKFAYVLMWIPVAAGLWILFDPVVEWSLAGVLGFVVAIWGGFSVRFVTLYVLGMINFWTTRGSAIFQIIVTGELLLSGRLVPLELMPEWVEALAAWFPFKWTFQFPIDTLIGRLTPAEIATGIGIQIAWTAGLGLILSLVWRRAMRRYSAVGN